MGTLNYAAKYASEVDKRFVLGALSQGVINNNFDWLGVETVEIFSRDLVTLNNYAMTGTSRYGTPNDLGNDVQEMTLSQDKSFTYIIDRKTAEDTNGTMEAAATLAENVDNVVIPTLDKYRFSKIVANAPTEGTVSGKSHIITATVTKSNAYEEFLKIQEVLDDDKAPAGGRIAVVGPSFLSKIKLDENFVKRGDLGTEIAINGAVGEIDGIPVVKVPTSYLPANVDFFVTNPICAPSPVKFAEFKIHTDAPGISGSLVEARFYYDCFVLNHKKDAIAVHKHAGVSA